MVTAQVDLEMRVQLDEIVDRMELDDLTVLAMYIAARLNEAPEPVEIAWPEGRLVIDPSQAEPECPRPVSLKTRGRVDLDAVLNGLDRKDRAALARRLKKESDEEWQVAMRALYYTCRDGDREKVFEMARELACQETGRIC